MTHQSTEEMAQLEIDLEAWRKRLDEREKNLDQKIAEQVALERDEICKLCCRLCGSDNYEIRKSADGTWNHYGKITRDIVRCDAEAIRERGKA